MPPLPSDISRGLEGRAAATSQPWVRVTPALVAAGSKAAQTWYNDQVQAWDLEPSGQIEYNAGALAIAFIEAHDDNQRVCAGHGDERIVVDAGRGIDN